MMFEITALMDNKASENKALINEHGLCFLIERNGRGILFDASSNSSAIYNASKIGKEIGSVDKIVLSHSHYDHAAGFKDYLSAFPGKERTLYTGKGFFYPKYAFDGKKYTNLSCGFTLSWINERKVNHKIVDGILEIDDNVYAVGDFPRLKSFETIPSRFVIRTEEGFSRDEFSDEICLVLDKGDALAMICGCSHPGILNMAERVHEAFHKPIEAIYGGTHLLEADDERLEKTLERLREMGVKRAGFCHCSGLAAEEACNTNGPEGCHLCVGDSVFF